MFKLLEMDTKIFTETTLINKIWRNNSILYLKMLKANIEQTKETKQKIYLKKVFYKEVKGQGDDVIIQNLKD